MLKAILMGLVALLLMSPAAMAAPDTTPSDTSEIMQTDTTQPTQPAGIALADLEPRYVTDSTGRRIGVSFLCPKCRDHRGSVNVDPPFDPGPPAEKSWWRTGKDFTDLSLHPSISAIRRDEVGLERECWHGHIRAGRAV